MKTKNYDIKIQQFAEDTRAGLNSNPKFLKSKYFYDSNGSKIFQEIMAMPEYYPTDLEIEILINQSSSLAGTIHFHHKQIALIELGSGDGSKTKLIIQSFLDQGMNLQYIPNDIDEDILNVLEKRFAKIFPNLNVLPVHADYFMGLSSLRASKDYLQFNKCILFLGSNLGNFDNDEANEFLQKLNEFMNPNDLLVIGFDMLKNVDKILNAYNDPHGITSRFNLNHLERINRELGGNFDLNDYCHHTVYDPINSEVLSYLLSKKGVNVYIDSLDQEFEFHSWEPIFMERSRKFSEEKITQLANENQFSLLKNFQDKACEYTVSLWKKD